MSNFSSISLTPTKVSYPRHFLCTWSFFRSFPFSLSSPSRLYYIFLESFILISLHELLSALRLSPIRWFLRFFKANLFFAELSTFPHFHAKLGCLSHPTCSLTLFRPSPSFFRWQLIFQNPPITSPTLQTQAAFFYCIILVYMLTFIFFLLSFFVWM